jgi:Gram-negative bacterial TonB protein C-terminal
LPKRPSATTASNGKNARSKIRNERPLLQRQKKGNLAHLPSQWNDGRFVSFTIDEDGNVKDPFVSTPFFPPFEKEALYTINRSPKWLPAIEHNRCIQSSARQPVIFKNAPEH